MSSPVSPASSWRAPVSTAGSGIRRCSISHFTSASSPAWSSRPRSFSHERPCFVFESLMAQLHHEVPELRPRPSVRPLSESGRQLRGLRRGLHAATRRRSAGLPRDRSRWPSCRAGASCGRDCLLASRLARIADLGTCYRACGIPFAAAREGDDRWPAMADRHARLRSCQAAPCSRSPRSWPVFAERRLKGVGVMKAILNSLRRFALTGLMVLLALWAGYKLWDYYFDAPWTRDGHVRADVVPVAPDVSGFVTEVLVKDNQRVERGDVLFRIDRARYAIALAQADAVLEGRRATLDQANADLKRYSALTTDVVVTKQKMDQVIATQATAKAAYDQAVADRDLARLNLERSDVRASVSGVVTNMELRPGTYLTPGKGVMALLDTDTLNVQGYFEETKLARIHVGDAVDVRLMGSSKVLRGRVESVAAGIEDRDRSAGSSLLANVNPTFNWVRLAQRVPVRIALDRSARTDLVAGATATVEVLGSASRSVASDARE